MKLSSYCGSSIWPVGTRCAAPLSVLSRVIGLPHTSHICSRSPHQLPACPAAPHRLLTLHQRRATVSRVAGGLTARPLHCTAAARQAGLRERIAPPGGLLYNLLRRVGVLQVSRARLKMSGYYLYESVVDTVDYQQFYTTCQMADTFMSWYLVTELHVWMLSVRLMENSAEGIECRKHVVQALWDDVAIRTKKVGPMVTSVRNEQMQLMGDFFKASLISYDEGLQEDRVLAGTVWRRLFLFAGDDVTRLETVVAYVRRELARLDQQSGDSLLRKGRTIWGRLNP